MLLNSEVAASAFTDPDVKSRFVSWVATECLEISQKRNRLALYNSFLLKAGGASQSALTHARKSFGYSSSPLTVVSRGLVHRSTANRRLRQESAASRASIPNAVDEDACPRLHWIDNYAKCYAANSIFIEREQFRSMLWTAHGMKKLPFNVDMSWVPKAPDLFYPALPNLQDLLGREAIESLFTELASFERLQFDTSFAVLRHVTRIPLKPSPATPEEKVHLDISSDGLRFPHPVDIYPENVV